MDEKIPAAAILPARPPLGMYPAKLDDKGRIKLPAVFQEYLGKFTEGKFFCTSLDKRTAVVYPIPVWEKYQDFLNSYTEDPESGDDVLFTAQDLGAEAEMDSQGRITLNSQLRQSLDLAGQELHLMSYRGAIRILTHAEYEARRMRADANAGAVTKLEKAGLGQGIK